MEDEPAEVVAELGLIACDASGTLYGLFAHDSDHSGNIAVCDLRHQLVEKQHGQAVACHSTTIPDVQLSAIIHPSPPLAFSAQSVAVASSGRYLAVYGSDHEEEDQAVVAVVDLHGSHPHGGASPGAGSGLPGGGRTRHRARVSHRTCGSHLVDYSLFASRPGLTVRQVSWHPYSESHLVLLASDSRVRVYHVSDLSTPELTLHVKCAASETAGSGRYGLSSASSAGEEAMAFAFGSSTGFGPLTLYVLSSVGALYSVCPFAATGMRLTSTDLHEALTSVLHGDHEAGPGDVLAWLDAALGAGSVDSLLEQPSWTVLPHVLEGLSPSLQGPLNAGSESLTPSPASACALAALHHQHLRRPLTAHLTPNPGLAPPPTPDRVIADFGTALSTTTALVSGHDDGRLWAHVLLEPVLPAWATSAAPPRVERGGGSGGDVVSVRYECVVTGDAQGSAVLLDTIVLHEGQFSLRDEFDGDDDEGSQGPRLPLTLCALCGAGSSTVVASHAVGSWALELPWLPLVGQQLANAREQQDETGGASVGIDLDLDVLPPPIACELVLAQPSSEGQLLLGVCCIQDVFVGRVVLLLQQPGVLHSVRPAALLAAAENVLQQTENDAGTSTPPASSGAGGLIRNTPPGGGKVSTPGGDGPGGVESVVNAAVQAVYADLLAPVPTPRMPASTGATPVGTPEGAAYLTAAIRAMRQGPVEAAHRIHVGLTTRAAHLDKEAAAHQASVQELSRLMPEIAQRQAALAARAARAVQLHKNLQERAALLTQLHWSLPRPCSEAEKQLSADLDVAASRQEALTQTWSHLRSRAQHVMDNRQQRAPEAPGSPTMATETGANTPIGQALIGGGQGSWWLRLGRQTFGNSVRSVVSTRGPVVVQGQGASASTPSSGLRVPAGQLASVHDALLDHMGAISRCSAEVARLRDQVRTWSQQNQCDTAASKLGTV